MPTKKTIGKTQLLSKKDLFQAVQLIRKLIRELISDSFHHIGQKIDKLGVNIKTDLKAIRRSNTFLEKEIIANRLKIKELEHRLNTFTFPKEKVQN